MKKKTDFLKDTGAVSGRALATLCGISDTAIKYFLTREAYIPKAITRNKILKAVGVDMLDYMTEEDIDVYNYREKMLNKEPPECLLKAVEKAGSVENLAKLSLVRVGRIKGALKRKNRFSHDSINKIAAAVGMSPDEFMKECFIGQKVFRGKFIKKEELKLTPYEGNKPRINYRERTGIKRTPERFGLLKLIGAA